MRIVFYDGDCGLCQRSVQILYNIDKRKMLKYAPLLGDTHRKILGSGYNDLSTVVYFKDGIIYTKGEAFLEVIKEQPFPYKMLYILKIIPLKIINWVYDIVANNRKKIACIYIPKDERFLP